jgi:hypothetical protein
MEEDAHVEQAAHVEQDGSSSEVDGKVEGALQGEANNHSRRSTTI